MWTILPNARVAFARFIILTMLASSLPAAAVEAPERTDAFVAYCRTGDRGCADRVEDVRLFVMLNPAATPRLCFTKESRDLKMLTSMVVQWLSAHPELGDKPTGEGIKAAIVGLLRCNP
jgi:hypothetical protein